MTEAELKTNLKDIKIECSAHATEDLEKVKQAMRMLLPEEMREDQEIKVIKLRGHAGNPINLLKLSIEGKSNVKRILAYLSTEMADFDKEILNQELDDRLGEENCLYLRFNKQDAYREEITLDSGDNTIKLVVKFVIYKPEPGLLRKAIKYYGLIKE
ncbi:MAG: hypothetical protein GF308_09870 [Candidatus Heimdallarchaeota archaeon]|nr:hypothetical protein [Candidatus Heimdallarchaeota archaeon]